MELRVVVAILSTLATATTVLGGGGCGFKARFAEVVQQARVSVDYGRYQRDKAAPQHWAVQALHLALHSPTGTTWLYNGGQGQHEGNHYFIPANCPEKNLSYPEFLGTKSR